MDQTPEDTREPGFRLFKDGTTLEEIAFKRTKLPKERSKVAEAFQDAFELVGGVPRLAMFADENYSEFSRLYARMIPRDVDLNVKGTINIVPALPPTPLDGEFVECGPSIAQTPEVPKLEDKSKSSKRGSKAKFLNLVPASPTSGDQTEKE